MKNNEYFEEYVSSQSEEIISSARFCLHFTMLLAFGSILELDTHYNVKVGLLLYRRSSDLEAVSLTFPKVSFSPLNCHTGL